MDVDETPIAGWQELPVKGDIPTVYSVIQNWVTEGFFKGSSCLKNNNKEGQWWLMIVFKRVECRNSQCCCTESDERSTAGLA